MSCSNNSPFVVTSQKKNRCSHRRGSSTARPAPNYNAQRTEEWSSYQSPPTTRHSTWASSRRSQGVILCSHVGCSKAAAKFNAVSSQFFCATCFLTSQTTLTAPGDDWYRCLSPHRSRNTQPYNMKSDWTLILIPKSSDGLMHS